MPALVAGIHAFFAQTRRGWPGQARHDGVCGQVAVCGILDLPDFGPWAGLAPWRSPLIWACAGICGSLRFAAIPPRRTAIPIP